MVPFLWKRCGLLLVEDWSVLRWFYYGIWNTKGQSFAGLDEMASDHGVITFSPLQLRRVRSLVTSLIWLTSGGAAFVCHSVLLLYSVIWPSLLWREIHFWRQSVSVAILSGTSSFLNCVGCDQAAPRILMKVGSGLSKFHKTLAYRLHRILIRMKPGHPTVLFFYFLKPESSLLVVINPGSWFVISQILHCSP